MPKKVDHDSYRQELISAYFDLFAKRGYLDVPMREIASTLGVSTGTLYHYFPNKKSLLEQLFHMASRRDASAVLSRIPENGSLADRLKVFCDYVMENETYFQDIVLLTIDYYRYQDDTKELFEFLNEADRYYGETFIQGLGLPPEISLIAEVFLNGLVYHRLVFPESLPFDTLSRVFQEMFVAYAESRYPETTSGADGPRSPVSGVKYRWEKCGEGDEDE